MDKKTAKIFKMVKDFLRFIHTPEWVFTKKVLTNLIIFAILSLVCLTAYRTRNVWLQLLTGIVAVAFGSYTFVHSSKKQMCARFFTYLVTIALFGGIMLYVPMRKLLEKPMRAYIYASDTPVAFFAEYFLFMLVYGAIWVLASYHYNSKAARLANSIVNTCLVILTTVFNFYMLSLPANGSRLFGMTLPDAFLKEVETTGYTLNGFVQITFNSIFIGFIIIRLVAALALDIKEYQKSEH